MRQESLLPEHDLVENILEPTGAPDEGAILAGPVGRKSAAEHSAMHFNSRGIRCVAWKRADGWVVQEDV